MIVYFARHTLGLAATLLAVATIVFFAVRALPGDPATVIGGTDTDARQIQRIRTEMGLDAGPVAQYGAWLGALSRGDLGISLRERRAVRIVIAERLGPTLALAGYAFALTLVLGLTLGVLGGLRPGGLADRVGTAVATVGLTVPEFWLGFLLLYVLSVQVDAFPLIGLPRESGMSAWIHHLTLPALTLAFARAAQVARLTRAYLAQELGLDYVRTARSKGLGRVRVARHVIANAVAGTFPLLALELGGLLTGTIVVEQVFGLPGVGAMLLGALSARDYPVVQGIALLAAVVYVLVNALADLAQLAATPRLRVP